MNPGETTILLLVIGVCAVVVLGFLPWRRIGGWVWGKLGAMLRRNETEQHREVFADKHKGAKS